MVDTSTVHDFFPFTFFKLDPVSPHFAIYTPAFRRPFCPNINIPPSVYPLPARRVMISFFPSLFLGPFTWDLSFPLFFREITNFSSTGACLPSRPSRVLSSPAACDCFGLGRRLSIAHVPDGKTISTPAHLFETPFQTGPR